MPRYVSEKGVWKAAREKVGLTYRGEKPIHKDKLPKGITIGVGEEFLNPGDSFIYNGPDRQALKEFSIEGVESFGTDFRHDPDFIQMVRTRGFQNVEEYLAFIGYNEEEDEKRIKKEIATIKPHEITDRVEAIEVLAGGRDYSGGGEDIVGGFGEAMVRKPSANKGGKGP